MKLRSSSEHRTGYPTEDELKLSTTEFIGRLMVGASIVGMTTLGAFACNASKGESEKPGDMSAPEAVNSIKAQEKPQITSPPTAPKEGKVDPPAKTGQLDVMAPSNQVDEPPKPVVVPTQKPKPPAKTMNTVIRKKPPHRGRKTAGVPPRNYRKGKKGHCLPTDPLCN
ncbi:hypothetical protein KKF84_20755 [Myxococcota bacterium]|nr:hypothetical protein [Myxococcota bacterium]